MYLIVRAIGSSDDDINATIDSLMTVCQKTLTYGKYDFECINYTDLALQVKKINSQSIKAVVKNENLEMLNDQNLPYSFAYDKLTETENDLSRIVSSLISYPDCAVSFQLIPTTYTTEETMTIDRNAHILENIAKGIMTPGMGSISNPLAEKHAETYKYYSKNKNSSAFFYNILLYGSASATNSISTTILAQLDNKNELRVISLSPEDIKKDDNFYPLPWAVNEILLSSERNQTIWNSGQNLSAFYRLPYIITSDEASEFFRLPIGSDTVNAGLNVSETDKRSTSYADNIIGGGDISLGKLKSSSRGDTIGLTLKDLTKHMLIVGTPGSGKTTFSISLLDRLWKDHGIPFLVIEPAKNEYRALVQSIPDLQVFTPGKNFISPFVFNPFVPPKNVKLETYKSTLKTAFAAAVSMSSPLDKIFEESINNCYSDFRWLDTYTSADKGKTFNISDFIKCFEETFNEIGYTGDAKNIGRAGLVRLQSLVNLFDNYHSIPIEDLLSKPTVIELAAIENSDQKALIISLLLLSILAYVNCNYIGDGKLRNVVLLEEAHVLLDADDNKGEGEANPSAIAQKLVKRMLAEIRSYGVGLLVADQSPRKVSTDVVALTDIKIAFRLVEAIDKQILSASSNMSESQQSRLSKLKPGEAFLFFGKLDEPEEIKTEDYRQANNIDITLSDADIKSLSTYWTSRSEQLKPYPECSFSRHCAKGCDFNHRTLGREVARRIFVKNFKRDSADSQIVKDVFSKMPALIQHELNDELYNTAMLACTEIHLLRRINYGTKIKISDATIQLTISKI
jgi:DNA helicase HerA-like ATPase